MSQVFEIGIAPAPAVPVPPVATGGSTAIADSDAFDAALGAAFDTVAHPEVEEDNGADPGDLEVAPMPIEPVVQELAGPPLTEAVRAFDRMMSEGANEGTDAADVPMEDVPRPEHSVDAVDGVREGSAGVRPGLSPAPAGESVVAEHAAAGVPHLEEDASVTFPDRRERAVPGNGSREPERGVTPNAFGGPAAQKQAASDVPLADTAAAVPDRAAAPPATEPTAPASFITANVDANEGEPEVRTPGAPAEPADGDGERQPAGVAAASQSPGNSGNAFERPPQGDHGQGEPRDASPGPSRAPAMAIVSGADGTFRLAAAATPEPVPASLDPADRAENVSRLVHTMRVQLKNGVSEATVRLRPEHLGEVTIAIRVDGRSVSATIHAESADVREWLQSQEAAIRGSLGAQGLQLDRLHVARDPREERREQPGPPSKRSRSRQGATGEPRFEVVV